MFFSINHIFLGFLSIFYTFLCIRARAIYIVILCSEKEKWLGVHFFYFDPFYFLSQNKGCIDISPTLSMFPRKWTIFSSFDPFKYGKRKYNTLQTVLYFNWYTIIKFHQRFVKCVYLYKHLSICIHIFISFLLLLHRFQLIFYLWTIIISMKIYFKALKLYNKKKNEETLLNAIYFRNNCDRLTKKNNFELAKRTRSNKLIYTKNFSSLSW